MKIIVGGIIEKDNKILMVKEAKKNWCRWRQFLYWFSALQLCAKMFRFNWFKIGQTNTSRYWTNGFLC